MTRSKVLACASLSLMTILTACEGVLFELDDDDTAVHDDDTTDVVDLDGDGVTPAQGDCDDEDATVHPGADEICDGLDNDCDGEIPESEGLDSDADGIPDCEDDDCDVALPPAATITQLQSCPYSGPVSDPWLALEEWAWRPPGGGGYAAPAVGHLGVPGDVVGDVPSIVTVSDSGCVHAIHGDGSGEIFSSCGFRFWDSPAIADVDGDGSVDVIAIAGTREVVALDGNGDLLWMSETLDLLSGVCAGLTVADVEGDGDVEVIAGRAVIDGADGSVERILDEPVGSDGMWLHTMPVLADLDADGTMESIHWRDVFDASGALLWTADMDPENNLYALAVDVDADGLGEVVFVSPTEMAVHDTDGSQLLRVTHSDPAAPTVHMPCAADFDGDGQVEIALPLDDRIEVLELDGASLWWPPVINLSGTTGCSAFDFDADGAYELLFSDGIHLYILDGATGTIRFQGGHQNGQTMYEYPFVADVDADGAAEVVSHSYSLGGTDGGIRIFGSSSSSWPPAGPAWAIQDHAPMRVHADGHVPTGQPPSWTLVNLFRGRPPADPTAELSPEAGELCVASCENGPLKLTYGVTNAGWDRVRAPIQVACYAVGDGVEELVEVQEVGPLAAGETIPGGTFVLTPELWLDRVRIVVDDDGTGAGTVAECDEIDNAVEIELPSCP